MPSHIQVSQLQGQSLSQLKQLSVLETLLQQEVTYKRIC